MKLRHPSFRNSRLAASCLAGLAFPLLFTACGSSEDNFTSGQSPDDVNSTDVVVPASDDEVSVPSTSNGPNTSGAPSPDVPSDASPASETPTDGSPDPQTEAPGDSTSDSTSTAANSAPSGMSPSEVPSESSSSPEPTAPPDGSDPSDGDPSPSAPNDSGSVPRLPEITGTCPTFETGTATIAGLGGIALQVGPKKSGTGSLVFYWHGTGSSASEVNTFLPRAVREEILDAGGIIVSFDDSTGTGGDCSGTSTFSKDDFDIADLIAACAVRDHGIDPTRIYSTGCSAGGLQAGCMGAMRSSYIAAVAPNSGGEVTRQPIQDPAHTPAVMTMHGGSTDVVVVAFSRTSATYDAHMKEAGSFVVNCDHGGGHCRAPSELYSAAWEFMKAHPFGTEPSPYADGLPGSFPEYCAIY